MQRELHEFTQYITPDGQVYQFDSHDKFLISETGWGMPPIKYITQKSPVQHGETAIDYRLNPRVIQLVHRRNACSRDEYWENRSTLLNMIRPNRQGYYGRLLPPMLQPGKLRKILPDGSKRDVDVVIEQGPEFAARDPSRWDEWAFTETLRFIAHDPILYDPDVKSNTFTLASYNKLTFPFSFPFLFDLPNLLAIENLTNAGSWISYPTIAVTGPASGFTIDNLTTQKWITFNTVVSPGETITIDLRFGYKTVTNQSGINKINEVSAESDLATFGLVAEPESPSGANSIRIYAPGGDANTAVTISWYDRYIGI
jgi:hypothetical protein